ncbi:MAG: site-specific DNA-methyltransferase [Clostridia bacterium]|jgi:site-specific DNA-methyltransferase (adenine-specific)|nr:site-specific DNA-methyltransferase [Clostridia bacterium]
MRKKKTRMMEINKIYNEDCLIGMQRIPDKSIDMILCDLPYGTSACKWDVVIPFEPLWEQYKRIIKDRGAIVLFGSEPFSSYLRMSNIKQYKYDWVWDKHIPRGFQTAKYRPMNRHENIMVFGDGAIKYYPIMILRDKPVKVKNYSKKDKTSSNDIGKYNDSSREFVYTHRNPDTIIEGLWEANAGKVHPTQKPVPLMEYLIKTYTNEGELVLDNCIGSGTTAIACINTNRNYIGFELDKGYFEIAQNRIINHSSEKRLF